MNIKFCYQYRDGANYKQYNELVFANPINRSVEEISFIIKEHLIDSLWFVAKDWKIPNQFFKDYSWDIEIDHTWHEFNGVEETLQEASENMNIEEFILLVEKTKLPW